MIYKQFEETKKKYPHNTALVVQDTYYTYQTVHEMIIDLMPIFNEKNKSGLIFLSKNEFIVTFQLVLNATNNNFTCLDISTPIERVLEIVSQLQSQWIISLADFSHQGYRVKYQCEKYKIWEKNSDKLYESHVSHIYFSSGSTGKPKGILLSAEPLVHVVQEQAKQIGMTESKKFAWLLSPSFDASLSDIYVTLFSGAQLHICQFSQNKVKTLVKYFDQYKITHTDISPSILPLVNLKNLYLESMIFGGEVANENVIKDYANTINMYNAYGPTENTICSSLKKVNEDWTCQNIGTPISGVTYHIDSNKELLISGSNLCIGYLDSILNEKKFFIKDNIRYYKSGDLVEYQNGEYFYLGRSDRQFKYNGILISPEEIEQCAKTLGCIEAKCMNDSKFTLYYQGNMSKNTLRKLLATQLNHNMIPPVIVHVQSFNTNINGKTII